MGSSKGRELAKFIKRKVDGYKMKKAQENIEKRKASVNKTKNSNAIKKVSSGSQSESSPSQAASVSTYENADMLMRRSNAKKKEADFQKKVGTAMSARGYANERKLMDLSGKNVSMSGNDRLKRAEKIFKSAKKDSLSSVNMINDLKNPKSKTNRSATKGVSWINEGVKKNLKKK
jgi:hypothetical protein